MTNDELTDALVQAVCTALDVLAGACRGERVDGFALCTDDDVRTVYPAGSTVESNAESEEDDVRFIPVDWAYEEGSAAFGATNTELARRANSASDHDAHVVEAFECLVRALEIAKQTKGLGDDVLLIVTSTDPSPRLEQMAHDAVRRLNTPELYAEWKDVM